MDAHEREYAAAAAGMADQTPSPSSLPAVGDFVSGVSGGKHWSGYVLEVDERRLAVEVAGAWIVVPTTDMARF